MESHVRNNLWHLLRADSDEAQRARRRLGVGIACAVFLGGLLTAIGFVVVVLALSSCGRGARRHRQQECARCAVTETSCRPSHARRLHVRSEHSGSGMLVLALFRSQRLPPPQSPGEDSGARPRPMPSEHPGSSTLAPGT
jgi:hypothetical protein